MKNSNQIKKQIKKDNKEYLKLVLSKPTEYRTLYLDRLSVSAQVSDLFVFKKYQLSGL